MPGTTATPTPTADDGFDFGSLFGGIVSLAEPVFQFVDDQYITNQEQAEIDLALANAGANQTLADAQLTAANDAANFTEEEQKQLAFYIIAFIVIVLFGAIIYIITKTTKT